MKKSKFISSLKIFKSLLISISAKILLPILNKKTKIHHGIGGLKYHIYSSSALDKHIVSNGILPEYICCTNQLKFASDSVMFDIGANAGFVSCVLATKYAINGQVHAYEPDNQNMQQLEKNRELNSLSNLTTHKIALQDDHNKTKTTFYIRRLVDSDFNENRGLSSTLKIPLGQISEREVDCSTLDNEVLRLGINRLDFIKIDVEGGEFPVLKGAENAITKFHPVIQWEYSNAIDELAKVNNTEQSFNFLKSLGYLQYQIKDEQFLIPLLNVDKAISNVNILCFHNTKIPVFLQ
jgi:FkbM family methyltransferase